MGFEELIEHASNQERTINQFIKYPGYPQDHGDFPSWPELEAQRVEVGEDDGTFPATRPIVEIPTVLAKLLYLESSHILVRSEYEEAKQAALVANEANVAAFLVGGQSGIGPPL